MATTKDKNKAKAASLLKRCGYASGGATDSDAIEFSGNDLDRIMSGAATPKGIRPDVNRGSAAADAYVDQIRKGKSFDSASDAADVMRGFSADPADTKRGKTPYKEQKRGGRTK